MEKFGIKTGLIIGSALPVGAKTFNISVLYGIIAVLSLLMVLGYGVLVHKKEKWLFRMLCAVCVVNCGYFLLAVSNNLVMALHANRIAYLGAVFLPFFMLMITVDSCKIAYKKWVVIALVAIGVVMFLIAASPGWFDWYYKEVTFVSAHGTARLEKIYGPLHNLYFVYLFAYFATMVASICYAVIRKKVSSWRHAALLAVVTLLNVTIWLVEQFIDSDFEFLSVSYLISELLLMFLYGMMQDYRQLQSQKVLLEMGNHAHNSDLEQIETYWAEISTLSAREKDVLRGMLQEKKRREIAEELCITENTVKKHVTNIFSKLQVSNRSELFEKVKNR